MDLKDDDFIKKSKLSYIKCFEGDLHEGELMTLVCVQTTCTKKGLICPVCRLNQHEKHKTIPLKLFLSQIYDKFLGQKKQSSETNLNNLSDYLRQLDNIRLELLTVLREAVTQIAEKVKKVEQQIIQNYSNIRKLVLTQSTISTKLPDLIKMMIDAKDRDPKQVQEDFKKYASLMVYEKEEISFLENSKKIVEEYSQLPNIVNIHLTTMIPSLTKILDSLPLSIDKPKKASQKINYAFDSSAKMSCLVLQENNKQVTMQPEAEEAGGYVLIKEGSGKDAQSISFRIISTNTESIRVGMVLPDILLKNTNYCLEQTDLNHGLFCLSALGVSYQHNNPQKQDSQDTFLFGPGDVIDINWDPKTKKLDFSRRHALEKATIQVNLKDNELQNLKFVVGIFGSEDAVAIVDVEQ